MNTDETMGIINLAILVIAIFIVLFIVLRKVNLWYWKIDDSIKNQEEQIRLLKELTEKMK